MKQYIVFSFLVATITYNAHGMLGEEASANKKFHDEWKIKEQCALDTMATLNNYLDSNKPNKLVEEAAAKATCTELTQKYKHYWYDAKPLLHATIALKLAKTKAKYAAKLSCQRTQDLIKHHSTVALEEEEALSRNDRDLQAAWLNAEENVVTIERFERSFKEQARLAEKQREHDNWKRDQSNF